MASVTDRIAAAAAERPPQQQPSQPPQKISVQNRLKQDVLPTNMRGAVQTFAAVNKNIMQYVTSNNTKNVSPLQERLARCSLDTDELLETDVNPKHGYLGASELSTSENVQSKVDSKELVEMVSQKYPCSDENRPPAKTPVPPIPPKRSVQARLTEKCLDGNGEWTAPDVQQQATPVKALPDIHQRCVQLKTRLGPPRLLSMQNIKSLEREQPVSSVDSKVLAWTSQKNARFIANDTANTPVLQPKFRALPEIRDVCHSIIPNFNSICILI